MDEESSQAEPLTPTSQDCFNLILKAVQSGEACLEQDSDGRVRVNYTNEKKIPLSHLDKSKAHVIQEGKDAADVRTKVDVCLEMIRAIKENRAPSGVAIDPSKAKISPQGRYRDGTEFDRLKEVLGRGSIAGDIVVVKDNKTQAEHAVKTVMISEFTEDEVRAWVDFGESESFPSLYLFRMVDNDIIFHMEKIEHGVTLDEIINNHMGNMWQREPDLVKPFSLCMFHGLLSAVKEMHDKNWTHRDLHSGNVMLTKDTVTLKILDFGMAHKLKEGMDFDHRALKNDILNAVRLFTGLYTGQDFGNNFLLEKEIKGGTLRKLLTETTFLNEKDKEELLQLIWMTYQVTQDPLQAGYGDTTPIMEQVECSMEGSKVKMTEVLKMAAGVLFPDFYLGDRSVHAQQGEDVEDGARGVSQGPSMEDFDIEAAADAIPQDFIEKLATISM